MQRRIRGYFNYRWVVHRDNEADELIHSLPMPLRSRAACMLHESYIRRVRCQKPNSFDEAEA